MINASTITKALVAQLIAGLSSDYVVRRSDYINMDPDIQKWVGVYRGTLDYDVATLGSGLNSWKAGFDIKVIVQSSSLKSGDQAEDRMEEYLQEVLDVIMADKTIGNTVAMVNGLNVEYSYNEVESESLYFQNAEITLNTEVRTQ